VRGGVWLVLHLEAKKRGSMEQQLVALARQLGQEGTPATMVFSAQPAPFPGRELRAAGVDVRALDFAHPARAAARLAVWLAVDRPELVHFHFIDPYSRYVRLARLSGARVLVHDHLCPAPGSGLRGALKRARGAVLNPFVDVRVAVSRYAADAVARAHAVPPARIEVLENGIDLTRFRGVDGTRVRRELGVGEHPLIVCVARLDSEKGGETLLRAMPFVEGGAHLALAGEGPRLSEWNELVAALGVAGRVHFVGLRNDIEQLMAASSAVVVPSEYEEAFGLAVVEGMASARPVVVTRSGAMPELVGEAGLVVEKRDPRGLAAALNRLLGDGALATRLGSVARARAEERFGMERFVLRTLGLYQRVRGIPALRAA
jgi:glycosyltransferase involved in cell wall biosynthesis